jgi:pimeloyl-ACP methyl ester carboxylesterase
MNFLTTLRQATLLVLFLISLKSCSPSENTTTIEETAEQTATQIDSGITHLSGITSQMISTDRLNQHVLSFRESGEAVLFIHGNFSSATYWEEIMTSLPEGYRGIAPDLRGYGWTEDKLVDATKGCQDWSMDLVALMDNMRIDKFHVVGWSMGGGVTYELLASQPERVLSATLVSPVSPYGFGGTKGNEGSPLFEDFAGSGGGTVNPTFIELIGLGDRTDTSQNAPRNVINGFYYFGGFKAAREEDFLTGSLMQRTGDQKYPGDLTASENWPNVAPGDFGPINALTPKYINVADRLMAAEPKVPVLWVRGSNDMIVSDQSFFDMATLGSMGFLPGWPGVEVVPPQPMVSQTRSIFEKYQSLGGSLTEVVIDSTAHSPHIEKPDLFNQAFHTHLRN